jgi:transcriptional regulator with XRE-family HTH domain
MTRTSSPTVSRRWIALELKRLRHDAGLSQAEVAKVLRCQVPKISLMESAQRNVQDADLDKLLALFEVPDNRRSQYFDAAKNGRKKAWWERYEDHVIPDWLEQYVGLEQGAERLRSYQSAIVHGLLQTEDYIGALLKSSPTVSEERIQQIVDVRLHRQGALSRASDPLQMWAVMDEAVLRQVVGSHKIMQAQLEYLVDVAAEQSNITIQVLPFDRGAAYEAGYGSFTVLSFPWRNDPGVVYVENRSGAFCLESLRDVDAHSRIFDHLQALALSPEDSLGMLRDAAKAHK